MQTIRILSNIAYNTPAFFERTINRLISDRVLEWAFWIYHKADIDEQKDHIHFVCKPSSRLDTQVLREEFKEFDPSFPSKPLCCTSVWHTVNASNMEDWLLYAVHDKAYLASKGQKRNIRYDFSDIKSTDPDALRNEWNNIDRMKFDRLRLLYDAVEKRIPFAVLVQQGIIPITQRAQYQFQYDALVPLVYSDVSNREISHEDVDADGVVKETGADSARKRRRARGRAGDTQ